MPNEMRAEAQLNIRSQMCAIMCVLGDTSGESCACLIRSNASPAPGVPQEGQELLLVEVG
jgi:hypothetical protein